MVDDSTGRPTGHPAKTDRRRFAATAMEARLPGAGALLKRAAGGGIALGRLFLVRWEALRLSLGGGWDEVRDAFLDGLPQAIQTETGGALCLPFDEDGLLVAVDDAARPLSAKSAAAVRAGLGGRWPEPPENGPRDPVEIWAAVAIDDDGLTFRRLGAAAAGTAEAPRRPTGHAPSRLVLADADFAFFPVWDVGANHVLAHLCRPSWAGPDETTLTEDSPEFFAAAPDQVAAIDATLFGAAIRLVQDALDHYGAINVIVPVHSVLFDDEAAASAYFRAVDQEIWPFVENVMFELLCGHSPRHREVAAAVERFAGYGHPPMVRLPEPSAVPDDNPFGDVWSMGFDFSRCGTTDPDALFAGFREQAARLGCRCHVIGLTSTPETVAAVNAGFDFVGSDAIAPPLAGPGEGAAETAPADILKSILAAQTKR